VDSVLQNTSRRTSAEEGMAEVLLEYSEIIVGADGTRYRVRACGAENGGGHWQGWLEFLDTTRNATLRSGRETTQPNRNDAVYWATGLTPVYLEGALDRALRPLPKPAPREPASIRFPGPPEAPEDMAAEPPPSESILNPFSVYRKGEMLLRRQLGALSVWHLVNIIRAHDLSDQSSAALNAMPAEELIAIIVDGVKSANTEMTR
jgi:hypothetical protein